MSFRYPGTSMEEFNLDWVIKKIKELTGIVDTFTVVNRITWGGLHDPGKEYPRWCIVDTPTHEGYISIQPVPVGITIDNEDYWRQVANYSALYADFQNRIVALENTVGDASSGLVKDVADLQDKHYVLMADSYGCYTNPDDGLLYSWTDEVVSRTGIDAVKIAQGSRGFIPRAGVGSFEIGITAAVANHVIPDPDIITDIIVCAGANDQAALLLEGHTETELLNAIESFATYCKTTFPHARIGIGCIANQTGGGPYAPIYYKVRDCYKSIEKYGGYYIANSEFVLNRYDLIMNDLVHPNPTGFSYLYDDMVEGVLNGKCDVLRPKSQVVATGATSAMGTWTTLPPYMYVSQNNGNATFEISSVGGTFTFSGTEKFEDMTADLGTTLLQMKLIKMCDIDECSFIGADYYGTDKICIVGKIPCVLFTTTSEYFNIECPLCFYGKTAYIGVPSYNVFIRNQGSCYDLDDTALAALLPFKLYLYPCIIQYDQSQNNAANVI